MKIKGDVDDESPYIFAKSKGGGYINFCPN